MTTGPHHGDAAAGLTARWPGLADPAWRHARLAPPAPGRAPRVVIDTDAANEIDDPYAIAWALLSRAQLRLEAIYAGPFSFAHRWHETPHLSRTLGPFNPPDEGMWRSLEEIGRVLAAAGCTDVPALAGTPGYLPAAGPAPASDAVRDLVERAMAGDDDDPLYVLALGCPTNVAAALLLEPRIATRIVVVWTSGYPSTARPVNHSFNLEQDLRATHALLDSGVPLVYLPGYHVGAQLRLSLPEMERWVQPCGALGAYLHQLYTHNPLWPLLGLPEVLAEDHWRGYSWVIWDLVCVAWVLQPDWLPSELVPTPTLDAELRWQPRAGAPSMREAHAVRRDAIFADLFAKLAAAA